MPSTLTLLHQSMTGMSSKVLILLDADVVIHLFKADKISLLNMLFLGRIRMLDIVLKELLENRTVREIVENLFIYRQVEEFKFPTTSNSTLLNEYFALASTINGSGERACLVYCKHYRNIIASSNTTDIVPYCLANGIAYLTTLDFFMIAVKKRKMSAREANNLIQKITKNSESYLCCKSIEEHEKKHFDPQKLLY